MLKLKKTSVRRILAAAVLVLSGYAVQETVAAETDEFLNFSEAVLTASPEPGEVNMMNPNISDFGIGQIVLYVKAPNKDLKANLLSTEKIRLLLDGEPLYEINALCNPSSDANAYSIIQPPTYFAMGDYEEPENPFKDLLFIGFVFNDYEFVGGRPGVYRLEIPEGFFILGGKALGAYSLEYNVGKYWSAMPSDGSETAEFSDLDRISIIFKDVTASKKSSTINYSEYASAKWKIEFNGEDVSSRYEMEFNKGEVDFVVKEGMELNASGQLRLSIDHGYFTFNNGVASVPVDYTLTAVKGTSGIQTMETGIVQIPQGVYSLTGTKMLDNADEVSISNLPAGIYVAGGRKIIVK